MTSSLVEALRSKATALERFVVVDDCGTQIEPYLAAPTEARIGEAMRE